MQIPLAVESTKRFTEAMKTNELAEAKANWNTARADMAASKPGSKAWKLAADAVEFWSNKMAAYECYKDWSK